MICILDVFVVLLKKLIEVAFVSLWADLSRSCVSVMALSSYCFDLFLNPNGIGKQGCNVQRISG